MALLLETAVGRTNHRSIGNPWFTCAQMTLAQESTAGTLYNPTLILEE